MAALALQAEKAASARVEINSTASGRAQANAATFNALKKEDASLGANLAKTNAAVTVAGQTSEANGGLINALKKEDASLGANLAAETKARQDAIAKTKKQTAADVAAVSELANANGAELAKIHKSYEADFQGFNWDNRAQCPASNPGWIHTAGKTPCAQPLKIHGALPCGKNGDSAGCDGFGLASIHANLVMGDQYPFPRSREQPRPTHSSALFLQMFGKTANLCKVDGEPCSSTGQCRTRSANSNDFCNTRAPQALHVEPHGTNGIFIDAERAAQAMRVDAPVCDESAPSCAGEVFLNKGMLHARDTRFKLAGTSRASLRNELGVTDATAPTSRVVFVRSSHETIQTNTSAVLYAERAVKQRPRGSFS